MQWEGGSVARGGSGRGRAIAGEPKPCTHLHEGAIQEAIIGEPKVCESDVP